MCKPNITVEAVGLKGAKDGHWKFDSIGGGACCVPAIVLFLDQILA
jgi:hypothetical protein